MKRITENEARTLLREMKELKLIENTLVLRHESATECSIIAAMEDRACAYEPEEYPEDIVACVYDNGYGWDMDYSTLLSRDGETLVDKAADEQGYRCGGIHIVTEGVIDTYICLGSRFIAGKEKDIREIFPLLCNDTYCFIFTDRYDRYIELRSSAKRAISDFNRQFGVSETEESFLRSNVYSMTELYDRLRDENISAADTWREVIFKTLRSMPDTKTQDSAVRDRIFVKDDTELEIHNFFADGEEVYIGYAVYVAGKKRVSTYDSIELMKPFVNGDRLTDAGRLALADHVKNHFEDIMNKYFLEKTPRIIKELYGGLLTSDSESFSLTFDWECNDDFTAAYATAADLKLTDRSGEGVLTFRNSNPTKIVAYDPMLCEFNLVGSEYDF